jgi:hypothetical protein
MAGLKPGLYSSQYRKENGPEACAIGPFQKVF